MAREHVKTWQVGDVRVSRIVELWDFQDDIRMTMPAATIGSTHSTRCPSVWTPSCRIVSCHASYSVLPNR